MVRINLSGLAGEPSPRAIMVIRAHLASLQCRPHVASQVARLQVRRGDHSSIGLKPSRGPRQETLAADDRSDAAQAGCTDDPGS